MITLPKHIESTGFECVISCTTMVCMYWRSQRPSLPWNVSGNFNGEEWNAFFSKGLKYVRSAGVPFNSISRYLKGLKFPLKARLEFLPDIYELNKLIDLRIPPIVLYDRYFMLRGIRRTPYHSIVLVDKTKELFIAVDPSLKPKFEISLSKNDFKEAWEITHNATIIITPKTYKPRRRKIPSITLTLEKWVE